MDNIGQLYTSLGAEFVISQEQLHAKLKGIKAFVFDWDGVFNNGDKPARGSSHFSEVDSMGTNLLRFSHYLHHGELPLTAIISGEKNETAFYFCERECFHYSFFKISNKAEALQFLCEKEKLQPAQVAYVFDDVLDLPIAELCGLRILVNQKANPQFKAYCKEKGLADYITAHAGGQFAVREATELLTGLNGNFNQVITHRKDFSSAYVEYIAQRREIKPEFYTLKENGIEKT